MEEVSALIAFANKLAGMGLTTLLILILWGSWKGIWRWGKDVVTEEARLTAQLEWWRDIAVRATRLGEVQSELLKVKERRELGRLGELNKDLLG